MTDLERGLAAAGGADPALDAAVAEAFGVGPACYTSSIEACRALVDEALPGWTLHLGFDAAGVFPYASLRQERAHVEAEAATVPLAILTAALKARSAG